MPATQANILIEVGANLNFVIGLLDSGGSPLNITGYHARLQVRGHFGDASPVLSMDDQALSGLTLGGAAGTITVFRANVAIDTSLLDPSLIPLPVAIDTNGNPVVRTGYKAPYAVELIDTGGGVGRVLEGFAIITPEVCL